MLAQGGHANSMRKNPGPGGNHAAPQLHKLV